jgi:hypothetical protein
VPARPNWDDHRKKERTRGGVLMAPLPVRTRVASGVALRCSADVI